MILKEYIGLVLRSFGNIHLRKDHKDIFLFATARGGSTWLMEILASQPGLKYYDEPFNIRRSNVQYAGVIHEWRDVMPDAGRGDELVQFLRDLQRNRYRFMNPPPFRRHHRLLTDRIVFKIHGLEHLINDIKQQCNGSVVYLLRHPIPTTLSRHVLPRLDHFVASCHYQKNYLDENQIREIRRIHCNGNAFQRGILSWCFENLVQLRFADTRDWLVVTYEELLLNSEKACKTIAERLSLPRVDTMLRAINTPAANIKMSKQDTLNILRDSDEQKRKYAMVTKWRDKISAEDEHRCFEILDLFGLDAYRHNRIVAHDRYLLHADTGKWATERP
jgi:hypothetical protein